MYNVLWLITLTDAAAAPDLIAKLEALAARHQAARALIARVQPGSFNGGDLAVRLQFDAAETFSAFIAEAAPMLVTPAIAHVDGITYRGTAGSTVEGSRVYRVLLLSADGADGDGIAQLEAELRMMPHYIPVIRSWQLSRAETASGAKKWTHVWEQEYADAAGLAGPYMLHPYHWARVDRWFDPECPEHIVDVRLCHAFCAIDAPVI